MNRVKRGNDLNASIMNTTIVSELSQSLVDMDSSSYFESSAPPSEEEDSSVSHTSARVSCIESSLEHSTVNTIHIHDALCGFDCD